MPCESTGTYALVRRSGPLERSSVAALHPSFEGRARSPNRRPCPKLDRELSGRPPVPAEERRSVPLAGDRGASATGSHSGLPLGAGGTVDAGVVGATAGRGTGPTRFSTREPTSTIAMFTRTAVSPM